MADELSDSHISLLCDIAQANPYEASQDKMPDVAYLVQAGYVRKGDGEEGATLVLTEKASTFLSARGATLNEA
jgi:hypothetical protein